MEETKKEIVKDEIVKDEIVKEEIDIDATSEVTDETKEEEVEEEYIDAVGMIPEVTDEDILKNIAERMVSLRREDKRIIRELSVKYGIDFKPRGHCNECYIEQACKIYAYLKESKPTKSGAVDGYQLREGLNVTYHGWHICADTLTKENAEKWLADGFPTKYFIKMPKAATK